MHCCTTIPETMERGMTIRCGVRELGTLVWAGALLLFGVAMTPGPLRAQVQAREADAVVDRAMTLMGGATVLRGIERARFEFMTQWQRLGFREIPSADRPSFEPHTDVRDYTLGAWRNTREFPQGALVNIVRDSVAITGSEGAFRPQSIAYVDERDELFLYTPDRLVLELSASPDRRLEADTLIAGEPHRIIAATARTGQRVRTYFHAGTGLPTLLRFRAAHPNDFGLVPWGEMAVEVWYSGWRTFGEVSMPTQWDILRVGRPYKRLTIRRAEFNPVFAADSFTIADDHRAAFLAARGPMHDRPVDSVAVLHPGLVALHGFGYPTGAIRTDAGWFLFEAGQHPLVLERALTALREAAGVDQLAGAILVMARTGNGAVSALADTGIPLLVAPAAAPFVQTMLANGERSAGSVDVVREVREVGIGSDRVQLAPVDLPDAPGSLMIYSEALGWLYAPDALSPLDVQLVRDRARALGWQWQSMGTVRGLVVEGRPGRETRRPS